MYSKATKKHRAKKVGKEGREAAKPHRLRDIDKLMSIINNNLCDQNIELIDAHIQTLKDLRKQASKKAKESGVKSKIKQISYEELMKYAVKLFIEYNYPKIPFFMDSSGARMRPQTANLESFMNKEDFSTPDTQIAAMRSGYGGLYLELKTKDASPYLKDGSISTNPHTQAQAKSLEMLSEQGYKATFAVGFTQAVSIICEYLNTQKK